MCVGPQAVASGALSVRASNFCCPARSTRFDSPGARSTGSDAPRSLRRRWGCRECAPPKTLLSASSWSRRGCTPSSTGAFSGSRKHPQPQAGPKLRARLCSPGHLRQTGDFSHHPHRSLAAGGLPCNAIGCSALRARLPGCRAQPAKCLSCNCLHLLRRRTWVTPGAGPDATALMTRALRHSSPAAAARGTHYRRSRRSWQTPPFRAGFR